MLVEDVMTTEPVTVSPTATIKHAVELLERHRVTSLPVVKGAHLHGLVSEADLIRDLVKADPRTSLRPHRHAGDHPRYVEDVMSRHAVTARPETDLAVAVDLLTSTTIKSIPVVDDRGRLRGMLSRSDVVRTFARSDEALQRAIVTSFASVGLADWIVEVQDGVAEISGADDAETADVTVARVMASSVPGVVDVQAGPGPQ
ncbi:HPP family protein [Nocardioides plantarum]|uniref:HPP family protein n=1 Tax=Nocardioides plantarum TaxID=29299 RepID=A0ABV5K7I4_9ACTN|nr:CBS domain-containing protein [Nocardioides plantarum]